MAGTWASLPADLLKKISGHLSSDADHLHIHQVCSHWRASTPSTWTCRRPCIVASRPWPWSEAYPVGLYSMWHLDGDRRVDGFPDPPAGVPWCCGVPRGWLALSDHEKSPTRLVLWDPSSGAEISLPALPSVHQVFLAADPLASPRWMAVASQGNGTVAPRRMFFWRPGDELWSLLTMDGGVDTTGRVVSVAFHDGKMFFTNSESELVVYDLNLGTTSPPAFVWRFDVEVLRRHRLDTDRVAHVVACNGDLLVVVLDSKCYPSFAEVYRPVDWTAADPLQLGSKVTDLGGYSLFLGRGDTLALRADDFTWIKRNHVYFLPQQWSQFHWAIMFDLESGIFQEYQCPQKHRQERGDKLWPYSWFCLKKPFFRE